MERFQRPNATCKASCFLLHRQDDNEHVDEGDVELSSLRRTLRSFEMCVAQTDSSRDAPVVFFNCFKAMARTQSFFFFLNFFSETP
jgi:hypothetical protein